MASRFNLTITLPNKLNSCSPRTCEAELRSTYKIEHHICDSLHGKVYAARKVADDEHVAIKTFSAEERNAPRSYAQSAEQDFHLEMKGYRLLAEAFPGQCKITSPFVTMSAAKFDSKEQYGYIVSEYVQSVDLFEYVATNYRDQGMPHSDVVVCFNAMVQAMNSLKKKNLTHGDISLENWIWDKRHPTQIKLIDYSTVQELGAQRAGEGTSIKLGFVPPEGFKYGFHLMRPECHDMFALGVCLFIMLTGIPPFLRSWYSHESVLMNGSDARADLRQWKYYAGFLFDNPEALRHCHPLRQITPTFRHVLVNLLSEYPQRRWCAEQLHEYWSLNFPPQATSSTAQGCRSDALEQQDSLLECTNEKQIS